MADTNDLIKRVDAMLAVTERIKQIGYDNDPLVLSIRQAIVDVTSAQPETLTDSEKRIFLAAMERERKICQTIDEEFDNKEWDAGLQYVCREIKTGG